MCCNCNTSNIRRNAILFLLLHNSLIAIYAYTYSSEPYEINYPFNSKKRDFEDGYKRAIKIAHRGAIYPSVKKDMAMSLSLPGNEKDGEEEDLMSRISRSGQHLPGVQGYFSRVDSPVLFAPEPVRPTPALPENLDQPNFGNAAGAGDQDVDLKITVPLPCQSDADSEDPICADILNNND